MSKSEHRRFTAEQKLEILKSYGVRSSVFTFTSAMQGAAHYNYYRDYDPDTGRYLQPDPIGLAGGLNPYVYANANPLRFSDPLGLVPDALSGSGGVAPGEAIRRFIDRIITGDVGARLGALCADGMPCSVLNAPLGTESIRAECLRLLQDSKANIFGRSTPGIQLDCEKTCRDFLKARCEVQGRCPVGSNIDSSG